MPTEPSLPRGPSTIWAVVILVVLALPIVFFRLGSYGLVNNDEAFYHYVARNMLRTGDWLRLEFTGQHRLVDTFQNAPLQYWMRAGVIALLGDNYWSMRILSALFALAGVLMTFRLTAHLAGTRAGLLAGLIQLTLYQYVYLHCARTGEIEPFMCFALVLAASLFVRAVAEGRSFIPHHLCVIALMNLKLALVFVPLAAEAVALAALQEARPHARRWLAAAWILPLGLAWHATQYFMLGDESLRALRSLTERAGGPGLSGLAANARYYAEVALSGSYPYALAFPFALAGLVAKRGNAAARFGERVVALYAFAVIGFFLVVARTNPWYIMPAYPFLCVALGIWLEGLTRADRVRWVTLAVAGLLALLIGLEIEGVNPFADVAGLVQPALTGRAFWGAGPWLGIPAVAALLAYVLELGRRRVGPGYAFWVASVLTVAFIGVGALRVAQPLVYTGHVTELDRIQAKIAALRAAGEPLPLPIPVHERGHFRVRFFFEDEFVIADNKGRDGVFYWLVAEERRDLHPPED